MTAQRTRGVLDGIRVLDLTQMVSGPLCTLILGDLGADVIKIEPEAGDSARQLGLNRAGGESDYFLSMNRNKRSVVLDLKAPKDLETFFALAQSADVLVENFRPGTMARIGISYEKLKAINPGLVYCGLSGFGSTGEYRDRPALDPVIQAMSGIMHLTGTPSSGPLKTGVLLSDFVPPLFAVIGILGALRARDASGQGQEVEISMLDATVFSMVPREQYFYSTGTAPGRYGNAHYQIAPWNTYEARDGRNLLVVAHTEKYWRNLVTALDLTALLSDSRFASAADRLENRDALDALLAARFTVRDLDDWTRRLTACDALFAPVRDMPEVLSDPVIKESLVESIQHPSAGELSLLRTPIRMTANPPTIRRPPPLLGQHTNEVLAEYGSLISTEAQP
jgi:CoA:oxalate CoA-transferase